MVNGDPKGHWQDPDGSRPHEMVAERACRAATRMDSSAAAIRAIASRSQASKVPRSCQGMVSDQRRAGTLEEHRSVFL
jgi:hypothetical protein